jgi:hypothetical protein
MWGQVERGSLETPPVDQSAQPEDALVSRQAERLILYNVRMFCSSDFVFIQRTNGPNASVHFVGGAAAQKRGV